MFFADSPIKGSPFRLIAKPRVLPVDHNKVTILGEGASMAKVYRQSEFTVDGSLAGPGKKIFEIEIQKTSLRLFLEPKNLWHDQGEWVRYQEYKVKAQRGDKLADVRLRWDLDQNVAF